MNAIEYTEAQLEDYRLYCETKALYDEEPLSIDQHFEFSALFDEDQ